MFEIVVLIIIGWVLYKKIKAKQEDSGGKGNNSLPNTTATAYNPKEMFGISGEEDLKKFIKSTEPIQTLFGKVNEKSQAQNGSKHTVTHVNKPVHEAIQEAKEDGNTTTAYLMEKAEADQREHAREKYEEQKRLYETSGGLTPAERYLDGDTIPRGRKCVICGYCGAENLIPIVPKTKYSCYFCREAI